MKNFKLPFRRLTTTMLLLVIFCIILPIASITGIVYIRSVRRFESMLIKENIAETSSYVRLLEREMQAIRQQAYSLLSDDITLSLLVEFETGQSTRFTQKLRIMQDYIGIIQNNHDLVRRLEIYYPRVFRKVTASTQYIYSDNEEIREVLFGKNEYGIWNDTDNIVCCDMRIADFGVDYNQAGLVVMHTISRDTMKKYLQELVGDREGFHMAVCAGAETDRPFLVSTDPLMNEKTLPQDVAEEGYSLIKIDGRQYLLTYEPLENGLIFYQQTSFDQVRLPMQEYRNSIQILAVLLLGVALLFTQLFYRTLQRPIEHARQTFLRLEKGELGVQMGESRFVEFEEMYRQFNSMSRRIQQLIEREYELLLLNTRSQIKQLQYQINPHFLYNTYFMLRALLQNEEYDNAERVSDIMGRYLKYITVSDADDVFLKEEIEHAKSYVQIQQVRFSRRITVDFQECPAQLAEVRVPRLVIQPLIENVFEHGLVDKLAGGILRVRILGSSKMFSVFVEDNGEHLTEERIRDLSTMIVQKTQPSDDGVALFNIHRRLVLIYGKDSGLIFSRSQLGGLCCELRIVQKGEINAENTDC